MRVYAETAWRRLRRGRLLWGSAVVAVLPLLVALIGVFHGRFGAGLFDESLEIYLRLLLPLAPVLLAAQVVGEEIEARTFTFLWARPAPRAALILGKCVVYALALLPGFLIGTLLTFAVAMVRADGADVTAALPHLARVGVTVLIGVPVYTALAAGVGTLVVRHPTLAGLLYVIVIEGLFASIAGVLKATAVSFYLRALAGLQFSSTPGVWEPRPSPVAAALVALLLGAGWLFLATWLVSDAEYREAR